MVDQEGCAGGCDIMSHLAIDNANERKEGGQNGTKERINERRRKVQGEI